MSTRRKLLLLAVCLLLGAAINVAVAWGCALWSRAPQRVEPLPLDDGLALWIRRARPDWPPHPTSASIERSFGRVLRTASSLSDVMGNPDQPPPPPGPILVPNVLEFEVGWPAASLEASGASLGPMDDSDFEHTWVLPSLPGLRTLAGTHLPCSPLWPGLIINTIFYAAIVWMLIRGPLETRRRWREWHGRCGACGYPFGTSHVCTECGRPLPKQKAPSRKEEIV